jgi:hypothetical protein
MAEILLLHHATRHGLPRDASLLRLFIVWLGVVVPVVLRHTWGTVAITALARKLDRNCEDCGPVFFFTESTVCFLVNDQRAAQFFTMYLFLFLTFCRFRAHRAHHQEGQIVSIKPLVTVGDRSPTVTLMTVTRGCIYTICLSWWWAQCARNM